jgi:hypothetical protein
MTGRGLVILLDQTSQRPEETDRDQWTATTLYGIVGAVLRRG